MILGRQCCGNFDRASSYEWLVTNGLGGYASGTVALANTRRYHGLLMASLAPPVARTLLVAKIDVCAEYRGSSFELSSNEFSGGFIGPEGFVNIESFAVHDGVPTWHFALGDALLRQQIFMPPGKNTAYLRFELRRGQGPVNLKLRPFVTYRDYHNQSHGRTEITLDADERVCRMHPPAPGRSSRLIASQGGFAAAPEWYWNFWHRAEAERGLDATEDLFTPGIFSAQLQPGAAYELVATCEQSAPESGDNVLSVLAVQSKALAAALPRPAPDWIQSLAIGANQFIVKREHGAAGDTASIIAGYPWFADWGRDTMIALPGLATALQRYELAAHVLRSYAKFIDQGMLPNTFPDDGAKPEYNTADATLWMFQAIDDYLSAHRDPALVRDLFPTMMSIIQAHIDGTRFGIGVDHADGLLRAGEPGTQLTWMDAKNNGRAFTPRVGKPVEINALWINALDVTARLASRLRAVSEKTLCESWLTRAYAHFSRFWNESRGCLYDVIDVDGGTGHDPAVRPNQILAVALPLCPLSHPQMRAVVEVCARELLTSYGLRSLGPSEPGYIGRYVGDSWQRDSAYHMGTAWSWLLGPFARAHYRVHGDARRAQAFLAPIRQHLGENCLGQISEIFDGDAPHIARGCFAQAWSVAEILRSWLYLERRISTP